jgi:hypothetical protein
MADAIDMLKYAVARYEGSQTESEARRWSQAISDYEEMVRAAIYNRAPKFLRLEDRPASKGAA